MQRPTLSRRQFFKSLGIALAVVALPIPDWKLKFPHPISSQFIASPKIPDGWLLCDGSSIPIRNYPKLLAVLDETSFSKEFKLPDLRGRTIATS